VVGEKPSTSVGGWPLPPTDRGAGSVGERGKREVAGASDLLTLQ